MLQNTRDINDIPSYAWVMYCLIHIMRNIVVLAGDLGRQAVHNAIGSELPGMLTDICNDVYSGLGKGARNRIGKWIEEIWL